MSLQRLNGQYIRPGFNRYRYGCGGMSYGGYNSMSLNGSIYGMPRYGQAPGYVGTYFQGPTVQPEKSWKEDFWAAMAGFGTAIANNMGAIMALFIGNKDGG